MELGFALRCDLSKPYERWCKEQSVERISEYFDLQLGMFAERRGEGVEIVARVDFERWYWSRTMIHAIQYSP